MDSAETSTERLLADAVLERHPMPRRILVGGLGLGFTVQALADAQAVTAIDVVEIEPLLVSWLMADLIPGTRSVLADPRVSVTVADIHDYLDQCPARSYDAVLLDVDNGPDFLIHPSNAKVYRPPAIRNAARVLTAGGILAVWSAAPAPTLAETLTAVVGEVTELVRTVVREGRTLDYHVYLACRSVPAQPKP